MNTKISPAGAGADEVQPGRLDAIVEAVQRAWGEGDVDALDAVLAPTYVRRGRRSTMSGEQLKSAIRDMRRAFPDLSMTVEEATAGADRLAVRWTSTGTLTDAYLGLPPSGRRYSVSGATFSTLQDGLIVEESVVYDRRGEYSSLGMPLNAALEHSVEAESTVTPDILRAMHRKMVTGVTVVTVDSNGEPRGLAVNAFASVSLEPPLILICIQKSSSTYAHLIAAKYFGVNILATDQTPVARVFATKQDRKFEQIHWHPGTMGVPLIDGASAAMEVELQDTLHASTHTIFIGRVRGVTGTDKSPLIYTDGRFFDGDSLVEAREL